jgi:cytochrome P450
LGRRAKVMKRHRAVLNRYADEVIARVRASGGARDDVLGALLQARPSGRPLAPRELRGHVLGLFLAGNETTGAALSWALVHGARNPSEWTKLRADHDRAASSFLAESLSLDPAVWGIPRTPKKPGVTVTAAGITTRVRRGQLATVYLRGINRDARIWEDPQRFAPSRHDRDVKERQRALLPFGLGPRGCVGQHLAMAEMTAVVPALARHGNVSIDEPITEDASFALRFANGLTGRFTASPAKE